MQSQLSGIRLLGLVLPKDICPRLDALARWRVSRSGGVRKSRVRREARPAVTRVVAHEDIGLLRGHALGEVPPEEHSERKSQPFST